MPEKYTCAACKADRKETNHWWTITEKVIDGNGATGLTVSPWGPTGPRLSIRSGRVHRWEVCGQACALKKISEWMGRPAAAVAGPLAAIEKHIGPEGQDITAGRHGMACAACGSVPGGCPVCAPGL